MLVETDAPYLAQCPCAVKEMSLLYGLTLLS